MLTTAITAALISAAALSSPMNASAHAMALEPTTPTKTSVTAEKTLDSSSTLAAATIQITCTISVDNAHVSHTDPSKVNVHSVVTCKYTSGATGKAAVDRIVNDVTPYKQDIIVLGYDVAAHPAPRTTTNSYQNNHNAAAACPSYPKTYYGAAKATVTFPSGYTPRTATIGNQSPETALISPDDCSSVPPAVR